MAKYKVIKPFHGNEENRDFTQYDTEIELTVKRAEEIQKNIDKVNPDYGKVLERIEEPKTTETAEEKVAEKTAKDTTAVTPKEAAKEITADK